MMVIIENKASSIDEPWTLRQHPRMPFVTHTEARPQPQGSDDDHQVKVIRPDGFERFLEALLKVSVSSVKRDDCVKQNQGMAMADMVSMMDTTAETNDTTYDAEPARTIITKRVTKYEEKMQRKMELQHRMNMKMIEEERLKKEKAAR